MKRVVIDTNVVVSGLLFGGKPGEIVTLWKKRKIKPLSSGEIIQEYLRVLAYPRFQLTEAEIDFILSQEILPWFQVIDVKGGNPFIRQDPLDDKFIWCALAGKAEWIISGDEHLLGFKASPIPILSVQAFLRRI